MKTFDEKIQPAVVTPVAVNCPNDVHVWASDTPKDWDACACGKFYYVAVKTKEAK